MVTSELPILPSSHFTVGKISPSKVNDDSGQQKKKKKKMIKKYIFIHTILDIYSWREEKRKKRQRRIEMGLFGFKKKRGQTVRTSAKILGFRSFFFSLVIVEKPFSTRKWEATQLVLFFPFFFSA
jgi:hypothetical protein